MTSYKTSRIAAIPTKKAASARNLCPVQEDSELHHAYTCSDCSRFAMSSSPLQASASMDSSVFGLPEVAEEDIVDGNSNSKFYRPRSGSTGLKNLFSFRKSSKSTDSSREASPPSLQPLNGETTTEKPAKGFKSFFRPRSQSDAAAARNAMNRRRHISQGGSPISTAGVSDVNGSALRNSNTQNIPAMRERSTSWGAKDRLAFSKQTKKPAGLQPMTPMSQLISGGGVAVNRKIEQLSPGAMDQPSNFTGKAFIWQRACSVDESSRRPVLNAQARRAQFLNNKWNTADVMETEFEDLVRGDPEIFTKFMKAHKCYDLIPTSAKLIVFDTQLNVKKAFYALVYNCIRAAPLWDSARQDFVGMLTISDFISILTRYYISSDGSMDELEEHKICTWMEILGNVYRPLIYTTPDSSLYEAVQILIDSKVHRLPVIDPVTGNALYILTHKRVLKYLYIFMRNLPQPAYMDQTIEELCIGTYSNIATVSKDTKLIDALSMFVRRKVSALPVVNENNQVESIYAKFDVINLAADKTYSCLEVPISQALGYRKPVFDTPVQSCHKTNSLKCVVEKLVKTEVHRLVIVDHFNQLEGVVSLSDVLKYLVKQNRHLSGGVNSASCSVTAVEDKMDVFPSEPLEAV